jgi:hypothetical protein
VLSAHEAGHLRDFITEPAEERQTFLEEAGGVQIFESFVKVLASWPNETDIRYVVTLVDELLRADGSRADLFLQVKNSDPSLDVCQALLTVLDRYSSGFLLSRAAHALSLVITAQCKRGQVDDAPAFIAWIVRSIQAPSVRSFSVSIELSSLTVVLMRKMCIPLQPKTLVPALAALKELMKNDLLHSVFVYGESEQSGSLVNLSAVVGLLSSQSQNTQVFY